MGNKRKSSIQTVQHLGHRCRDGTETLRPKGIMWGEHRAASKGGTHTSVGTPAPDGQEKERSCKGAEKGLPRSSEFTALFRSRDKDPGPLGLRISRAIHEWVGVCLF